MQRSGRDESRTPCIPIRYTRYILRIYNIAVKYRWYCYRLRLAKTLDTCSGLDDGSKQDVRATRTLGVKFPVSPRRPGEQPCCGNTDTPVSCRAHASPTHRSPGWWSHERHAQRFMLFDWRRFFFSLYELGKELNIVSRVETRVEIIKLRITK